MPLTGLNASVFTGLNAQKLYVVGLDEIGLEISERTSAYEHRSAVLIKNGIGDACSNADIFKV